MISLSIAPLTKAGFAPFGEVVETADVKPKLINEGFAERFDDLAGIDVAAEGGEVNISLFDRRCKAELRSSSSSWSAIRWAASCSCR